MGGLAVEGDSLVASHPNRNSVIEELLYRDNWSMPNELRGHGGYPDHAHEVREGM